MLKGFFIQKNLYIEQNNNFSLIIRIDQWKEYLTKI